MPLIPNQLEAIYETLEGDVLAAEPTDGVEKMLTRICFARDRVRAIMGSAVWIQPEQEGDPPVLVFSDGLHEKFSNNAEIWAAVIEARNEVRAAAQEIVDLLT